MSLPFIIDTGLDGEIVLIAEGTEAVRDIVASVATQVPAQLIAEIATAAHSFHEHGGPSLAAEFITTLQLIPERTILSIATLTPTDALALGAALQRVAITAFENPNAPEVEL